MDPVPHHAILVGISRYQHPKEFKPLDGPHNDIARVREWLIDQEHIPEENIAMLSTPDALLTDPATPPTNWTPTAEQFSNTVRSMTFDANNQPIRRTGRLYLYFAGHGFSMARDGTTRAAVYAADAHPNWARNFGGTVLDALRRGAYFSEIVLIMDCCRDAEVNRPFEDIPFHLGEHDTAEEVRVFSLYATHKRGKAQESALPDSGGKVVGLLTDGFLKALAEAPPDVLGMVPVSTLRGYMELRWPQWYASHRPDAPRFVQPQKGDILLRSRAALVDQMFVLTDPTPGRTLQLISNSSVVNGEVRDDGILWHTTTWSVLVPIENADDKHVFHLRLMPVRHTLYITDDGLPLQFNPRNDHVISI